MNDEVQLGFRDGEETKSCVDQWKDWEEPLFTLMKCQELWSRRQNYPNDKMVYHSVERGSIHSYEPSARAIALMLHQTSTPAAMESLLVIELGTMR